MGNYPTLEEAVEYVSIGTMTACAFDRQFAVDNQLNLWYKNVRVGKVQPGKKAKILFDENKKYLSTLLKGAYEEADRIPCLG